MATTNNLELIYHTSASTASVVPVANDNLEIIDAAFASLVLRGILADRPADPGQSIAIYYVTDVQGMIAYIWDNNNTVWIDVPVTTTNTGYGTTAEIPATANVGDIFTPSDQPDIVFYVSNGAAWIPIAGGSSGGGGGSFALTGAIPEIMTDEYANSLLTEYTSQVRHKNSNLEIVSQILIPTSPAIALDGISNMVLHPNGLIYFINSTFNLYKLNPETAELTLIVYVGSYSIQYRGGIDGDNNVVFTLENNTTTHRLVRLDTRDDSYVIDTFTGATSNTQRPLAVGASPNGQWKTLLLYRDYILDDIDRTAVMSSLKIDLPTPCDYWCHLHDDRVMLAPYISDDPFYMYNKSDNSLTTIASPGFGSFRHTGIHVKGNRIVWVPSQLRTVADLIWVYNYVDDTWTSSIPKDFTSTSSPVGHATLYGWPCLLPSGEVWIQDDGDNNNLSFDPDTLIVSVLDPFSSISVSNLARSQNIMLPSGKMISGCRIGNSTSGQPSLTDLGFSPINAAKKTHILLNQY